MDSRSPADKAVPGTQPERERKCACRKALEHLQYSPHITIDERNSIRSAIAAPCELDGENARLREEVMQLHTAIELYKGAADQLRAQLIPNYAKAALAKLDAAKDCSPDPCAPEASTEGPQGGQP